jgi:hypothetical protein
MNADIKNQITEPRISIRRMHTAPYEVTSYINWIFAANMGHIVSVNPEDRRFNIAVYQTEKLVITDAELRVLDDELTDFYCYLATREASIAIARTPLNNAAKQKMILLNQPAIDVAADALLTGDLEYFWDQRPHDTAHLDGLSRQAAERYTALLNTIVETEPKSILREELHVLFEYVLGGMPQRPAKFSSYLKHHKIHIQSVTRGGEPHRGHPTKWKVKPEWKGAR